MSKNIITKLNSLASSMSLKDFERLQSRSVMSPETVGNSKIELLKTKRMKEQESKRPQSEQPKKLVKTDHQQLPPVNNLPGKRLKERKETEPKKTLQLHGVTIYPSKMNIEKKPPVNLYQTLARRKPSNEWIKSAPELKGPSKTVEFIKKRTEEDQKRYKNKTKLEGIRSSFDEFFKVLKSRAKSELPRLDEDEFPNDELKLNEKVGTVDGIALKEVASFKPNKKTRLSFKGTTQVKRLTTQSYKGKESKSYSTLDKKEMERLDGNTEFSPEPNNLFSLDHKGECLGKINPFNTKVFETPVLSGMKMNQDQTLCEGRSYRLPPFVRSWSSTSIHS